jgi:hypothetical protein
MIFLVAVILVAGCVSKPVKPVESAYLFPDGTYQQDVVVHVIAPGHESNFDFNCAVKKSPDQWLFVGYNSFGISLFKIRESNGDIQMESSIKQINEKKDFFLKVFELVKSLVNIQKTDDRLKQKSFTVDFQDIKSTVEFSDYDQLHIPLKIKISTPSVYDILIQTTKYEFLETPKS